METAAEQIPTHNDDMNDHMNVMIQVDWHDGENTWRANFTHVSQYLDFKRNLDARRNLNIMAVPFIQNIETVYY